MHPLDGVEERQVIKECESDRCLSSTWLTVSAMMVHKRNAQVMTDDSRGISTSVRALFPTASALQPRMTTGCIDVAAPR